MHTKGKWEIAVRTDTSFDKPLKEHHLISYPCGKGVGPERICNEGLTEANAHRFCTCVNGWDELEAERDQYRADRETLKDRLEKMEADALANIAERDALRAALQKIVDYDEARRKLECFLIQFKAPIDLVVHSVAQYLHCNLARVASSPKFRT